LPPRSPGDSLRFLLAAAIAFTSHGTTAQTIGPVPRSGRPRGRRIAGLPRVWGPDTNLAWRTAIPGRGWSSPIVWGGRVFLTTAVSEGEVEPPKKGLYPGGDRPEPPRHRHHWRIIGVDANDGRILWTTEVKADAPATPVHLKHYASETPVTDGERVMLLRIDRTVRLDLDGKVLWTQSFPARRIAHGWGTAASPVVWGTASSSSMTMRRNPAAQTRELVGRSGGCGGRAQQLVDALRMATPGAHRTRHHRPEQGPSYDLVESRFGN
jgi:hypothetical protein